MFLKFFFLSKSSVDFKYKIDQASTDALEREKMKWMEDVPDSVKLSPDTLYSARFDFEGTELLSYVRYLEGVVH